MPKARHVWGIDIGQCAFKALRCRVEGDQVVADGFDYIEYPKILSQPEADPQELVQQAIRQFLSRNSVRGDDIAVSVSGQSGLAKFFKPPPVDIKRIPDIVRYEAKQQIPFTLEEVIWDYQKMPGGQIVEGFAIDTEVGLFAMKREQVYRAMQPFDDAGLELDIIQLAPLSIYNFVTFDLLKGLPDPDMFDPDNPPESVVVLSMGTDATDLVVTNGFRVWQRSIPLGGSHFTKQLTKELKLTFAKAEHLKRNARQAEDPKSVFQAMRPVFNDMVTEVQRSIGYFQGIDRQAKIRGVVLLGNTVKLPGLQQYIAKNLGYEVIPFERFQRLNGSAVQSSPAFNDNILSFGVCYGLCLQALGKGQLASNLLPREIVTRRMIRAKKPWAVASVGALMLAFVFNFIFSYRVWSKVQPERQEADVTWKVAENKIEEIKQQSANLERQQEDKLAKLKFLTQVGNEVAGAGERRLLWLELLKGLEAALPWTPGFDPKAYVDFKTLPLAQRQELFIDYIESEYFPDLQTWFTDPVRNRYYELQRQLRATGDLPPLEQPPAGTAPTTTKKGDNLGIAGPTGPGWVIELAGYHYFNDNRQTAGATHVRNTLLKNLELGSVRLPIDKAGTEATFTMKELGISFPALVQDGGQPYRVRVPNPEFTGPPPGAPVSPLAALLPKVEKKKAEEEEKKEEEPPDFQVLRYDFTVQFCWQETLLGERVRKQQAEAEAEASKAAPGAVNAAAQTFDGSNPLANQTPPATQGSGS